MVVVVKWCEWWQNNLLDLEQEVPGQGNCLESPHHHCNNIMMISSPFFLFVFLFFFLLLFNKVWITISPFIKLVASGSFLATLGFYYLVVANPELLSFFRWLWKRKIIFVLNSFERPGFRISNVVFFPSSQAAPTIFWWWEGRCWGLGSWGRILSRD